jgi:hypothetical protein
MTLRKVLVLLSSGRTQLEFELAFSNPEPAQSIKLKLSAS